jgi:hypothetical protein
VTTRDGDTVQDTPGAADGELPARLLAFLGDRPAAPELPAVDPDLVRRLRARATGCTGTRVPGPRRGQATSR